MQIPKENSRRGQEQKELARVEIDGLAFGGEGVGRSSGGKICFVPYTAPGDRAVVRITESKRKFDRGELAELIEEGVSRTDPRCPYFGSCGGCSWQHISYREQLRAKREHLSHLLRRRAGLEVEVPEPVPSPSLYQWRRSARLTVIPPDKLGFRRARSREAIPIERCPVLEDDLNEKLSELRVRLSEPCASRPKEVEIYRRPGESVTHNFLYEGTAPAAFLQANGGINEIVQSDIHRIISRLLLNGSDAAAAPSSGTPSTFTTSSGRPRILDLFCGDGNLSLPLADLGLEVEGYDASQSAVDLANRAAAERNLSSYRYRKARFPGVLKKLQSTSRQWESGFSLAILDPPRGGLFGRADRLIELGIPAIIYVSCIPSVLSRDLETLVHSGGYRIDEMRLYDMFPHTSHVETLAVLRKQLRKEDTQEHG